jgi:MoxR-like ATPase
MTTNPADPNGVKSCFGCPSMLTKEEGQQFFGKNLAAPVCAKFGKPIGKIGSTEKQRETIGVQLAKNCVEHGHPRPASPNWQRATFTVALPDPEIMRYNRKANQDTVRTCGVCEHFVRGDVVARELGFATEMCSAKGKLLLPSRLTYEARDCDLRSLGNVRTDVSGLMLIPEYADDFALSTDPVKRLRSEQAHFVKPEDWYGDQTDKPITDADFANGIQAWRKVQDPVTEHFTYLPVFKRCFFSDDEQRLIPATGSDEHPEDYVDHHNFTYTAAVLWRELDETPAAWGQAGVGKTEFGRYMAWLMQIPFIRVSITGSSDVEDLAGSVRFEEGATVWHDGRVVQAWSKPCVLLVDEPNAGPPDVFQFMRPMMDNSKQLVLDQNKGEVRDRHDFCHVIVAMNPAWDPKNVGTHVISDADANRMMHLQFELPPEPLERDILRKACSHDDYEINEETLKTIMAIAADVRGMVEEDTLPITWGIRPQLKVARASRWFDLKRCYRMAIADFLDPQQQTEFMDVVKSHVE